MVARAEVSRSKAIGIKEATHGLEAEHKVSGCNDERSLRTWGIQPNYGLSLFLAGVSLLDGPERVAV